MRVWGSRASAKVREIFVDGASAILGGTGGFPAYTGWPSKEYLVAAFKEAWETADAIPGNAGHRTEAGIDAVLVALDAASRRGAEDRALLEAHPALFRRVLRGQIYPLLYNASGDVLMGQGVRRDLVRFQTDAILDFLLGQE